MIAAENTVALYHDTLGAIVVISLMLAAGMLILGGVGLYRILKRGKTQ